MNSPSIHYYYVSKMQKRCFQPSEWRHVRCKKVPCGSFSRLDRARKLRCVVFWKYQIERNSCKRASTTTCIQNISRFPLRYCIPMYSTYSSNMTEMLAVASKLKPCYIGLSSIEPSLGTSIVRFI